jgi:hypothetical protein
VRKFSTITIGLSLLLSSTLVMADQPHHNTHARHFPQPQSRYQHNQHVPAPFPKIQAHMPMPIQPTMRRPFVPPRPPMFPPFVQQPVLSPVILAPQVIYPASSGFSLSIGGTHGGFSIYTDL